MYIAYRMHFQNTLIWVIVNIFYSKCMLYHLHFARYYFINCAWNNHYNNQGCNKTENSGEANFLNFKKFPIKILKNYFSNNFTYFIFQELGRASVFQVPLVLWQLKKMHLLPITCFPFEFSILNFSFK